MGSNYFSTCTADERISAIQPLRELEGGERWLVRDWDRRREVRVVIPDRDVDNGAVVLAVEKFLDDLPADVVKAWMDRDGALISASSEAEHDSRRIPFYPPCTDFPPHMATVRRGDLTEVDRFGFGVDRVRYSPGPNETRDVAFKYYFFDVKVVSFWHEINCVMRMPLHPNIVPFDALVVEALQGADVVVGYTTRFIPSATLYKDKTRVFKLKYLKQLIDCVYPLLTPNLLFARAVDFLNLRLGIVHGDICPWNLLIDPATDSIQLFDFNSASKLGWEGDGAFEHEFAYDRDRNDVKYVIFTVYEIITREASFFEEFSPHELDAGHIMRKRKWNKHQRSRLDSPVEDYVKLLREWVRERAKADKWVDHFAKASEPLTWPPLRVPEDPENEWDTFGDPGRYRKMTDQPGRDFLLWTRPASRKLPLPAGLHLLSTGEVVPDGQSSNGTRGAGPGPAVSGPAGRGRRRRGK